jgi:hypothetical protein
MNGGQLNLGIFDLVGVIMLVLGGIHPSRA